MKVVLNTYIYIYLYIYIYVCVCIYIYKNGKLALHLIIANTFVT